MVVSCEQVWQEISNYLEQEIDAALRAAMDEHLRGCKHCSAVLEGTRNVIALYGDQRMVEPPAGFSYRLRRHLEENMPRRRGNTFGWMLAAAAALLLVGSFEVGHSSVPVELRSEHARPANHIPPAMMVVVAADGKTFHVAGCTYIHDKTNLRTITAHEALKEGYVPCVRCLKKYLTASTTSGSMPSTTEVADSDEHGD